ncbi:hypothetical protein C7B67_16455 [filamentous cyanobacterium Phorm 6]|nr:hypothetical protein C7B67_16455 [filamentous cyanobacterium Phorm 6]
MASTFNEVAYAEILNTLVGGELTEGGEGMLGEFFDIDSDISKYTPEMWGKLTDRANQAQWLIDNFDLIKDRFEAVIKGQVKFRELQGWLIEKGFAGASKIKEAQVKALVAENDYLESVKQQDYKLSKERERGTEETNDFNRGIDASILGAIQAYKEKIDAQIASAKGNPEYEAAMAEYNANKPDTLLWASEMLKGGSYAANHPKFLKGNQQVISGFASNNSSGSNNSGGSGWNWGGGSRKSSADYVNANVARSANNLAGNFGRGLKRISNFFGANR